MNPTQGSEQPALPAPLEAAVRRAYREYAATATSRYAAGRHEAGARLADLVAAARSAGWPFRVLAGPCALSGERLRQIVQRYGSENPQLPDVKIPAYTPARRTARRAPASRPHLTAEQAGKLRDLAPRAAENTGSHAPGSAARIASEELTALLVEHHGAGVIWQELSDATRPWSSWPIPEDELKRLHGTEGAAAEHAMAPVLRVSGLRQRVARARR